MGSKGEVGKALFNILKSKYQAKGIDKGETVHGLFDVLHICFPYSQRDFVKFVKGYKNQYLAEGGLIVVHSSIPVGVCSRLGDGVVHSPVRGVHPHLEKGMCTFTKYFGGRRAEEAAKYFEDIGIPVFVTKSSRETEALKLWDTTQYGLNIILNKAIYKYCKMHNLDFDVVYTHANETYNKGYTTLGRGEVVRPMLKYMPGPIGGHCVLPNAALLGGEIAKFILRQNDKLT